ncbi:LANO_0G17524g1_1 [Lachancea nothofagi CBS 11611]|uniref:LANO_0G17524g1_1 n=1 Tax=Lachancea nothofagi CBS 11611 TaxID=1266666 RepID=A0A1G4KKR0_9SACH|nr:LANO_0G17524g1_1 [Lachancea nothofagi CBS 11611]
MHKTSTTPTKTSNDVLKNLQSYAGHSRFARMTPKAQVLGEALDAPPLKLGSKNGYRFPPNCNLTNSVLDSPSKPSKTLSTHAKETMFASILEHSPELTSDDDTLSDDSNMSSCSMISPAGVSPIEDLSVSPPPIKDFLLSSALLHSSLLNDGTLHEEPNSQLHSKKPDVLPLFSAGAKKPLPQATNFKPLPRKNDRKNDRQRLESLKSILKRPSSPDSLNYLVTATNGSLVNATIFATEINACTDKVPLPANKWERVTIPVNIDIRDQLVQGRVKLMGHGYEDCVDLDELEEFPKVKDAAIIRGYEYNIENPGNNRTGIKLETERKLRWDKTS